MDWKQFGLGFLEQIAANLLMGHIGDRLRGYPIERLNGFLIRFGKAFGPPWLERHYSALTAADQEALLDRVPVLRGTHTDWPKPFQWVPRTLTVWTGRAPTYADILLGNVAGSPNDLLKPIPGKGGWYVFRGYMTSVTTEGVADRIGWRYDDIDQYWVLSIALKLM